MMEENRTGAGEATSETQKSLAEVVAEAEAVKERESQADTSQKDKLAEEATVAQGDKEDNADKTDRADKADGANHVKKKPIWLYCLLVILVILLGVYGCFTYYYSNHYLKGTSIDGIEGSNLTVSELSALVEEQAGEYTLTIWGRDENGTATELGTIGAGDIGYGLTNTTEAASAVMKAQRPYLWPRMLWEDSSYTLALDATYDEGLLEKVLAAMPALRNGNMVDPRDAYISDYQPILGCYEIVPETLGTRLDLDAVKSAVKEALTAEEETVDLAALGCYEEADVKLDDATLVANLEQMNRWVQSEITYDWNGSEVVVAGDTIQGWISLEEDTPVLDEEAIKAFVKEQANEYDTYGRKYCFTTTLGVELNITRKKYGWQTDRESEAAELISLIQNGEVASREPIYSVEAREKGTNDIGSSYVEVDLTNQHLYLYSEGNIVLETDFVSGNMTKSPTPSGIFGLTYKTRNAVLRGDTYETPVSYWMPFYGNYGMHDANWRSRFGGTIYLTGGSHGCVNLPPAKAAQIYEYMETGFPVICYYYESAAPVTTVEQPATNTEAQQPAAEGTQENPLELEDNLTTVTETAGEF